MTVFFGIGLLFVLLAIGAPVGFAMGFSGLFGLIISGHAQVISGILSTSPISTVSSFEMITVPMFLLMAEFVLLSGIADDLFKAAATFLGRLPGGLGMATAVAGAGFGAICGTSTASAATLASTSLPAMIRQGYEPEMASGVVAISGTLSMLLPTSIALIVFGLLAQVDIGRLLIAGIVPALLVMITIMATVFLLAILHPERAPAPARVPWQERWILLRRVGPMIALFLTVTGVIYSGLATPPEASAVGALGALVFAAARGRVNRVSLLHALRRAAHGTCMIAMIIVGAILFGYFLTLSFVTQDLVAWVGSLDTSRWVILILILVGYLILGSFMDQMAILVLTVPIVMPMIRSLGFDPIWFGILKIVTAEVGMITPPIGLNCYVVARYSGRRPEEVFRGTLPHFIAHLIAIAILLAVPSLALWLPSRIGN